MCIPVINIYECFKFIYIYIIIIKYLYKLYYLVLFNNLYVFSLDNCYHEIDYTSAVYKLVFITVYVINIFILLDYRIYSDTLNTYVNWYIIIINI